MTVYTAPDLSDAARQNFADFEVAVGMRTL